MTTEIQHGNVTLRHLADWPDYWAGDDGHIYSRLERGNTRKKTRHWVIRRLSPIRNKQFRGLLTVTLYREDRRYWRQRKGQNPIWVRKPHPRYIHILVASVWLPPRPSPAHEIDHKDENRANNKPTNLRWLTNVQNREAYTQNHQGEVGFAFLTAADIPAIRALRGVRSGYKVAALWGVSPATIYKIWSGRLWKSVA